MAKVIRHIWKQPNTTHVPLLKYLINQEKHVSEQIIFRLVKFLKNMETSENTLVQTIFRRMTMYAYSTTAQNYIYINNLISCDINQHKYGYIKAKLADTSTNKEHLLLGRLLKECCQIRDGYYNVDYFSKEEINSFIRTCAPSSAKISSTGNGFQ